MKYEETYESLPNSCKEFITAKGYKDRTARQYTYRLSSYSNFIDKVSSANTSRDDKLYKADWDMIKKYLDSIANEDREGNKIPISTTLYKHILAALAAFYSYHVEKGNVSEMPVKWEEYKEYKDANPEPEKKEIRDATSTDIDAIEALISNASKLSAEQRKYNNKNKFRDVAILRIIYETQLSPTLLSGLNTDDVDMKNLRLRVQKEGSKDYEYRQISERTGKILNFYINTSGKGGRASYEPEDGETALFISRKHRRLAERSIQYMLKEFSELALDNRTVTFKSVAKAGISSSESQ